MNRKYSAEQVQEAGQLLDTGLSYREVGRLTGISHNYLSGKLFPGRKPKTPAKSRATGRPTGRPSSVTDEQYEAAYGMLVDEVSYRETARTLGIPRTSLREKFPGHGWTMSEGGKLGHFIMSNQTIHDLQLEIGLLQ